MSDILAEVANRFVLFPIKYNSIWQMYKKALSAFWTSEEIDLSQDYSDWEKLNQNEQFFIKHVLAFFAGSDGIVNENLAVRFMNEVQAQEAKCFYGFQIVMENIHCVSPDTEILTSDGYTPIGSHEGKVTEVWNGVEFSKVMVMKSSEGSDAYCVTLDNGMQLICTPNHEWLIEQEGKEVRVKTEDLEQHAEIMPFAYPPSLELKDQQIFSNVTCHGLCAFEPRSNLYNPMSFNCRPPNFVPVNFCKATKIEWLNGVFKHATKDEEGIYTVLTHDDLRMLKHVQLLLTTLDVRCVLDRENKKLRLNSNNVAKLVALGLTYRTATASEEEDNKIKVTKIDKLDIKVPMFCFEEPLRHTGIFNGILTGQSETYSLLLDTYIKDSAEKTHLLNAINTIPCIAKKAEWAMKWIKDTESTFSKRLVAYACVEGIFFSGAFCAIFWLKERGVMPGLCLSNEFISRDESLHTEFAIHLYTMLEQHKLSQETIHELVTEAVAIEDEFIVDSIPCNMLGMNSALMSQYIQFVADRLCVQLGYDKIYNVHNPFPFMDRIGLSNKSNFFEHTRQSEYAKARVGGAATNDDTFGLDAEF